MSVGVTQKARLKIRGNAPATLLRDHLAPLCPRNLRFLARVDCGKFLRYRARRRRGRRSLRGGITFLCRVHSIVNSQLIRLSASHDNVLCFRERRGLDRARAGDLSRIHVLATATLCAVRDIHTLTADELLMSVKWQNPGRASHRPIHRTNKPPRSHRGHCGGVCGAGPGRPCIGHACHRGETHDDYVRHPLSNRSVPERRI